MKLNFGLDTNNANKNRFIMWLLYKEVKEYKSCKPIRAKTIEKRIKFLKKKLLKKL